METQKLARRPSGRPDAAHEERLELLEAIAADLRRPAPSRPARDFEAHFSLLRHLAASTLPARQPRR